MIVLGYNYILGRSGAGKTRLCLNQIISTKSSGGNNAVIYIVPEQFSLQSEKNLLSSSGESGLMRERVLSFQRLAYHVFSEFGGIQEVVLDDTGKNMVLRKAIFEVNDKLKFFKGAVDKQGFIDSLSATVTEFYQYDISANSLAASADDISHNDNLRLKMHDLHLIFKQYQACLEKNYVSGDETLDILAGKVEKSKLVKDAEIWIDGFTGFTPQEYKVIEKLLMYAKNVTFSLTTDEPKTSYADIKQSEPFFETKNTIKLINELANNNSVEQGDTIYLNDNLRSLDSPDLKFLEENFFGSNVVPFRNACDNIKVVYADNINDEIHYTAKKITELVMERKYSFNEIAVITCAPSDYEKNIKLIFSQYNLPVFIDTNKDILSHPLTEFIRSALEIVAYNWQYESVFRLLKTNILHIPREKVDLLENYVLAYGIKRGRWKKPWVYGFGGRYEHFDELEMNELRLEVVSALEPLTKHFTKSGKYNITDISKALYDLLKNCGATDALSDLMDKMINAGQLEVYREHSQIWGKVISLLNQTVDVLGKEKISVEEYAKILEAGFSGTKLGLTPHSLDQIIIGDLRRTRLQEVKALFLLGANEGALPGKTAQSGILSDDDRRTISKEMRLKLAGDSVSTAYEEQFSIYSCISKPSEFLSLSCFLGGLDGKALRPSMMLDKISELLPKAEKITLSQIPESSLYNISSAEPTFNGFTSRLRSFVQTGEIPDLYKDAYAYFISDEIYKKKLDKIKKLMGGINRQEKLTKQSITELYSSRINSSVSKLEKYVQCPFSYFVQYNLSAKERKIYEVASVDLGNIFHKVLEKFALGLKEQNISMAGIDDEALNELADKSVSEAFALEENEILNSSGQYKYLSERMREISIKSIWALAEHMRNGKFELAFTEASFLDGSAGSANLGAIDIALDYNVKMQLEGRIDRVDIADLDGEEYIKIIDYKSGNKKFSFTEVFYGLQLQLLIYMDAFIKKYEDKHGKLNSNKKINPAAVFYFRLLNPVMDYSAKLLDLDESELRNYLLKQYKMSGVVLNDDKVINALDGGMQKSSDIIPSVTLSADGFKMLMDYSMKKAEEIGNEILSGNISASPYKFKNASGCKYCSYKAVCKLDSLQDAQKSRKFRPIKEKDAISEIFAHFDR